MTSSSDNEFLRKRVQVTRRRRGGSEEEEEESASLEARPDLRGLLQARFGGVSNFVWTDSSCASAVVTFEEEDAAERAVGGLRSPEVDEDSELGRWHASWASVEFQPPLTAAPRRVSGRPKQLVGGGHSLRRPNSASGHGHGHGHAHAHLPRGARSLFSSHVRSLRTEGSEDRSPASEEACSSSSATCRLELFSFSVFPHIARKIFER